MKQRIHEPRPSTLRARSRGAADSTFDTRRSTRDARHSARLSAAAGLLVLVLAAPPVSAAAGPGAPAGSAAPAERVYVVRTSHPERRTLSQSL